jgi:hypothetical protein
VLTSTPPAISVAVRGFIIMFCPSWHSRNIPHADQDRDERLGFH